MRRSICIAEPSNCLAGAVNTFRFTYTPATNLPKGTKLRFDMSSKGRSVDWEIPQTDLKVKKNLIWGELPDGKTLAAREIVKNHLPPLFEFTLPAEIKAGTNFTICIGSPLKDPAQGSRCQTFVQRRRSFPLQIEIKGKNESSEEELFSVDVRGNALSQIRIISPSLVARNKRFDVIVRFEDCYGNLTNNALDGTLVELSYENLRENLNWKLFVPETGFINLPNLYFNEPGVYKIQLTNLNTSEKFFSHPIKCLPESSVNLLWGLLHGESEKFDATDNIEHCLRHLRDEKALQFFALSPFEDAEETSTEAWKAIAQHVHDFNEDQRFTAFLGFQYFGDALGEGLRQIVYLKDHKPVLRKKDAKFDSLQKLYKSLSPKDALAVPMFSMAKGIQSDFATFDPEFEKIVEIYNAWGSSECSAKNGNTRPIQTTAKTGFSEVEAGSVINALRNNRRFGFVAGGLDDRGIFKDLYQGSQVQYSPGLTAVLATDHTREAIAEALAKRSCYATTGERIILGLTIAGAGIGCELSSKVKPGLVFNRHIVGYAAGTSNLKEVILMRNGIPFKTLHSKNYFLDFTIDDSEMLGTVVLQSPDDRPPFVFYYLKILQEDGHLAWSSPIWIDHPEGLDTPSAKKIRKSKS